jgi:hypothetical protein
MRSPTAWFAALEPRLAVIASKAKRSRLGDCGAGPIWIASLSLAMTDAPIRSPQNKKYLCAIGSVSAGSQTSSTPSAVTA